MTVRDVLRHRSFAYLLVGRGISLLGSSLASIAVAFAVLDLTGSATDLGLVLAARSLPNVVFLLVGGVVADRLPRHLVLVVTSVGSGASQALAAALLLTDHATIGSLMAIEAVNGASSAFVFPATSGMLPTLVPTAALQPANILFRMTTTAALVGGASAGGVVVAGVGPGWAIAVDAATFLAAAACFALMRLPSGDRLPSSNVVTDLREGWTAFRSRSWLWSVVIAFGVINACEGAGFMTLGPVIADGSFGRAAWGLVLAAQTAGMFLSGLVLLRTRFRRPLFVGMFGSLLFVPPMFLLAADPPVLLLLVATLVAGAGIEVFGLGWDLSMQQHVPPHLLSRVYSYDALGSVVAIPLGQVLAGPVAAARGVHEAVVLFAVLAMAAGVATLFVPAVRRLERTDLDAPAAAEVRAAAG
jgi:predicted MFS family arabinose efflux permease